MPLLNDPAKDYLWWREDRVGYETEMERRDRELNEQFSAHMGEDFEMPYLLSEIELKKEIENRTERLKKLTELSAPEEILQNEQQVLGDYVQELKAGNYLVTEEDRRYRDAYHLREKEFKFNFELMVPEKFK
jgi:hypothetical protein